MKTVSSNQRNERHKDLEPWSPTGPCTRSLKYNLFGVAYSDPLGCFRVFPVWLLACLWDFSSPRMNLGGILCTLHVYFIHFPLKGTGFPGGSMVKNLPAKQETQVWFLGGEDPLGEGMATHSCTLVWKIPWTEEPGGLQSMGLCRVGHDRSDWAWTRITRHRFFSRWEVEIWEEFHTSGPAHGLAREFDPGADCAPVAVWVLQEADLEPEFLLRELIRVLSGVHLCWREDNGLDRGRNQAHSLCRPHGLLAKGSRICWGSWRLELLIVVLRIIWMNQPYCSRFPGAFIPEG